MAGTRRKRSGGQEAGPDDSGTSVRFDEADYSPPCTELNLESSWRVPSADGVLTDIRAAGYSISRLVDGITSYYSLSTQSNKLGLLSALLESLKEDTEAYAEFQKFQTISEEAELILIEHTLRKQALSGEDTQAIKFFLERRSPDRYARNSKEVNDPQATAIAELVKGLKGG